MIGNNDGARTIILQYGGIFVRDGLFMPMIVNGKPPKAMKLSRAMICGDAISCHLRRHPGESRREWGGCGR